MGLLADSQCTFCSLGAPGTLLHMFWECPSLTCYWNAVSSQLSNIFSRSMPASVTALLLNDLSQLPASGFMLGIRKDLFQPTSAVKKLMVTRQKHPDKLSVSLWCLTFLDGIYMELSTAHVTCSCWQSVWDEWVRLAVVSLLLFFSCLIAVLVITVLLLFLNFNFDFE